MAPKGGARQAALAAAGLDTTQTRSQQRSRSPRAKGGAKQLARSQQPSASSTAPALAQPPATGEPIFRNLVNKLFMENKFSGAMAQQICQSAAGAGATQVADLGRAGASGKHSGNCPRDLMRALLKNKDLCSLYWAPIPLLDPGTGALVEVDFPFLLPHELFAKLVSKKPIQDFKEGASPELLAEFGKTCKSLGLKANEAIPIGLHGDGVPHCKKGTTECFSWNVAGIPHADRLLCAVVDKRACCKCGCSGRCTTDKILEILCWSFRCMVAGEYPSHRHDEGPWQPTDRHRRKLQGNFAARGLLCQVRGDWSWYKQVFAFPSWASENICWRCRANCSTMPWRDCSRISKQKHTHQPFSRKSNTIHAMDRCCKVCQNLSQTNDIDIPSQRPMRFVSKPLGKHQDFSQCTTATSKHKNQKLYPMSNNQKLDPMNKNQKLDPSEQSCIAWMIVQCMYHSDGIAFHCTCRGLRWL